jgi:hypothetical protein
MRAVLGFLALAAVAAGAPSAGPAPAIQYRVKVLEMQGLTWRESVYSRMVPVTRHDGCTVWTAGEDVVKSLVTAAKDVVMCPQVMAQADAVAHYSQRSTRRVASQLTRHADGPVDHAVAVAYTPEFEDVREGCQFTVAGRKLDQGTLVKLVVEDARITAIHHVKLTEMLAGKDDKGRLTPQLDVPEVSRALLEGEWLIPNSGVLVASLGAHTVDDGHGKAVVRERVLVLEAGPAPATAGVAVQQAATRAFTYVLPARPALIPMPLTMPVPSVPGRSLPQGFAADGTPVPLPPLPEAKVPTSIPGTSEPCATPQAPRREDDASEETPPAPEPAPRTASRPEKSRDPASARARFEPAKEEPKAAAPMFSPWTLLKPLLFRVPIASGPFEIQIRASITPGTKP